MFGCEGADIEYKYPVKVGAGDQYGYEEPDKFFGKDGITFFPKYRSLLKSKR